MEEKHKTPTPQNPGQTNSRPLSNIKQRVTTYVSALTPQRPFGAPASAPATAAPTGRKVLCIEDEHFIGELYDRALTKAGYKVKLVVDGAEGLKEAQTDTYDIILLDLMVPTITGIEVLRRLRDSTQTPKLHSKIIITTNLEQREEIRADIEHQADGYLVKAEVTPRELVTFLNTIK
jgi:CheY-like chemotaxis protein